MFFGVIHQISRSHGLKNRRFESNLSKITRPVAAIKSLRFALFSLILDSSVGLSASIQSPGDLVSGTTGSNPAFSRGTQLVSFRFEYRLPVPEHRN